MIAWTVLVLIFALVVLDAHGQTDIPPGSSNASTATLSIPENGTGVLHQSSAADQNPSTTVPTEVKLTGNSTNFQLQLAGASGFNLTGSLKELFSSLAKNGSGAEWSLAGTVLHAEPSKTVTNSSADSLSTPAANSPSVRLDVTTPIAAVPATPPDPGFNENPLKNTTTANVTSAADTTPVSVNVNVTSAADTTPVSVNVTDAPGALINVPTTIVSENTTVTTMPPPPPLPQLPQPCVNILPMCGFMAESPRLRFEMMAAGG